MPIFETPSDPNSFDLSPDAVQFSDALGLTGKLKRLDELRKQLEQFKGQRAPLELRQDVIELKTDLMASIQQARLEIDFVVAEIEEEETIFEESLRAYTNERDARVNKANLWAFRTNGVLWAGAEALDIPTYRTAKLSIPSGAIGIAAGLVPSIFSAFAVRASMGLHHERESYPNILSKLYSFPTSPRIEFPESVWTHLNSKPAGEEKQTRRELLMEHWRHNRNITLFKTGETNERLSLLTGITQRRIDMELLNDRLTMIRELKAVVLQMNRLLLEINMVMQEKKVLQ